MKIFEKERRYLIFESISLILVTLTYMGCLILFA